MRLFLICLALLQPIVPWLIVQGFSPSPRSTINRLTTSHPHAKKNERQILLRNAQSSSAPGGDDSGDDKYMPKIVVFDLDGCLWRPEMYELLYFSGGAGAPFTPSEDDNNILLTRKGEKVYLLGNVREVMTELYSSTDKNNKWHGVQVGISSRTDQPSWARELLQKFQVEDTTTTTTFALSDVFQGPIEIASDSKVQHFRRIAAATHVPLEDMLFFDNEFGNCQAVSDLGVTVAFCPGGVTNEIWKAAVEAFPVRPGCVVEVGPDAVV
jgi:magnesium-dependent phosphatase 1